MVVDNKHRGPFGAGCGGGGHGGGGVSGHKRQGVGGVHEQGVQLDRELVCAVLGLFHQSAFALAFVAWGTAHDAPQGSARPAAHGWLAQYCLCGVLVAFAALACWRGRGAWECPSGRPGHCSEAYANTARRLGPGARSGLCWRCLPGSATEMW